ncbi:hypothetical protein [Hyphomicrobium sp.]|uniref:hypothetical protein n=1 Tax=Hyphomicrobium sp. TaxID=82 RepID=UPI00132456F6|nr:hypothetical protein [Hyphomicrobium sp.]KAB2938967.1 MAG: hypothetical protein F9K20_18320 [Hyphomicrobium sp.]
MRSSAIGRSTLAQLVAAAAALVCTVAEAGELVVMPYACRVVGGAPVLTPAQDQGYRIFGRREERDFTECSPVNPDMCRRWKVYRFDVDCAGERVPWVSIAAAADTHSGGRSWVENGRMHLEMPPRWSMSPDDPCARRPRYGWRYGPLSRHCAERRAAAPADVEMPAGFAPMLELDAFFVADQQPATERGWAPAPAVAERAAPKTTRVEAASPTREAETPIKPPAAPPVAKSAPAPTPSSPAKPERTPASAPAAEAATATGTPLAPTIINGANAPAAKAEPQQMARAAPATTSALPHSKDVPAAVEKKDKPVIVAENHAQSEAMTSRSETPPAQEGQSKSITVTLVDGLTKSVSPALLGVGGVTVLGLLALLFAYRRDQAPGFTLARDIAAVSLDGRAGGRGLVRAGRSLATAASPGAEPPSPAPQWVGPPPSWGEAIPQTRAEALEVLGMGVAPEVSETAIKKIVDGLRLSWHPDHAKSAQDRELRELRMKQINAAWDIITGRRAG